MFSFSVRGGTNDFKEYVLTQEGYVGADGKAATEDCDFKMKAVGSHERLM